MKMTLIGLYNFDNTLFDNLVIPTGMDLTTLSNKILLDSGEFEVLYSDPIFLKSAIGFWATSMIDTWQHFYDTTQYDYNPIENYNRVESGTDNRTLAGTSGGTSSFNNTNTVTSFDSNIQQPKDGSSGSNTFSNTNNGTDDNTHTLTAQGNIGVTSTQDMIRQEREIILNLYNQIADEFKQKFLILIY